MSKRRTVTPLFFALCIVFFCQACSSSSSDDTPIPSASAQCTSKSSIRKVTLSGTASYENITFGLEGTTSVQSLPVQQAEVQVVRSSDSKLLATTATNMTGEYETSVNVLDGEEVYIRVLATSNSDAGSISVLHESPQGATYSFRSGSFYLDRDTTRDVTATLSSGAAKIFNMYSVLLETALFLNPENHTQETVDLQAVYPSAEENGTRFYGKYLFVCGDGCAGDDDGWDDAVLLHELGTYLLEKKYDGDFTKAITAVAPGYGEFVDSKESWTYLFPFLVRDSFGKSDASLFVDMLSAQENEVAVSYEINPSSFDEALWLATLSTKDYEKETSVSEKSSLQEGSPRFSSHNCGDSNTMPLTTFSGTIQYEDQPFTSSGFTGTSNAAVKYADVQIVSNCTSSTLGTSNTDASGNYSFSVSVPSGEEVYVRVLTSTTSSGKKITVKDSVAGDAIYSIVSGNVTVTGDVSTDLTATVSSSSAEPFNVFMVLIDSALFVESLTGAVLTDALTAYYSTGTTDGTYFDGTNLFICGGCSNDDDGWDDTIIMHEFGHYVAEVYSKDSSPGGQHSLTGTYEITLTWSEGWATFFSSAVRQYLGITTPEEYIDMDSLSGSTVLIRYEIETPSGGAIGDSGASAVGAGNEVAVSAVLWDIYDTTSDSGGFDSLSMGIGSSTSGIWGTFTTYLNTAASVSLEDFWDGWFSKGYGTLGGSNDLTNIFQARSIYYVADSYESNNGPSTATALTLGTALTVGIAATNLTFYPAGDADWFSFSYTSGNSYTIQTQNTGDRADPLIRTYMDPDGSAICQNDDISDSNLNSRIIINGCTTCSSTSSGTMYIKVISSSAPSNPATYGNYNIKVTQN